LSTRRAKGRDVRGLLLLDKPGGMTSNQALQRVKRLFQAAKAGHTGSLDPLATGMLPICFGTATRLCGYLLESHKTYLVTALLGIATDTADADGAIIQRIETPPIDRAQVEPALARFVGAIEQVPPMYSALKQGGVRLYELARSGVSVERAPRRVSIDALELAELRWPHVTLTVRCSKGTYVRTLIEDLAAALGTVGHVTELRRLHVEPFVHDPMTTLDALEASAGGGLEALDHHLLPLDKALPHWPAVHLGTEAAARLAHGQSVAADPSWAPGRVRVYAARDDLFALGEVTADRRLVPVRVFAP
jgi:tRNA pseudouridine55 synthase